MFRVNENEMIALPTSILLPRFFIALSSCLVCVLFVWLTSVRLRNVAFADRVWPLLILLSALIFSVDNLRQVPNIRLTLMLVIVVVWAIRLSLFITYRNWGKAEDRRYADIRKRNQPNFALKSLYLVFALQAFLACIVAMPFLFDIAASPVLHPWTWLDFAGVALSAFGLFFEAVADAQMAAFKKKSSKPDQVMHTGLWHYSRHPNYFGESCLWLGLALMAYSMGSWWAFVSPVLITYLLLKVSGINLQEQSLQKRSAEYLDYLRRTPSFFPWLPRSVVVTP